MNFNIDKNSNKLLILLLLTDLALILIHIYKMPFLGPTPFNIEKDRGYAELFQYFKEYWIVLLLFIIAIKRTHIIYFAWSILFTYLLFDDSLQIHEKLGYYLANYFDLQPRFNLRAVDFGELGVSFFSGLILFSFIGWAYLRSDSAAKQISKHLFILVLFMAFFGILVDMMHIAIPWGKSMWGLIEDGGEMIIMSIIVWYVFDLKFILKN